MLFWGIAPQLVEFAPRMLGGALQNVGRCTAKCSKVHCEMLGGCTANLRDDGGGVRVQLLALEDVGTSVHDVMTYARTEVSPLLVLELKLLKSACPRTEAIVIQRLSPRTAALQSPRM